MDVDVAPPEARMRARLRDELPPDTFRPQPVRALWFVPAATVAGAGTAALIHFPVPWPLALLIALVIGQAYAAMAFLAHETLHGSTVRSRRLQDLLGFVGLGPVLVSPTLWRVWHNQVHHTKTNKGNSDPDGFGTLRRYQRMRSTQFVARLAPGSRHWSSYLFFGYWFTFHGQMVLWLQSKHMRGFADLNRRRAIAETFAAFGIWVAIAIAAGPVTSVFAVVIPIIATNATIMSYIATNHFLRPLTETNDPIENSMSVMVPTVVDRLHCNFSHHVEHHLFPKMSPKHAPRVREWLVANAGDEYLAPPHWRAIRELYRTPRVYKNATTLCDPHHPERTVTTDSITEDLRSHATG